MACRKEGKGARVLMMAMLMCRKFIVCLAAGRLMYVSQGYPRMNWHFS
jgi:hypothetical protein